MPDRDNVIAGLTDMKNFVFEGSDNDKTLDAAIAMLKEQEPKKVIFEFSPSCPKCRKPISDGEGVRFCCFCGQEVKWYD